MNWLLRTHLCLTLESIWVVSWHWLRIWSWIEIYCVWSVTHHIHRMHAWWQQRATPKCSHVARCMERLMGIKRSLGNIVGIHWIGRNHFLGTHSVHIIRISYIFYRIYGINIKGKITHFIRTSFWERHRMSYNLKISVTITSKGWVNLIRWTHVAWNSITDSLQRTTYLIKCIVLSRCILRKWITQRSIPIDISLQSLLINDQLKIAYLCYLHDLYINHWYLKV